MKGVFILLGSNRGDRSGYISRAVGLIGETAGTISGISPLYETDPWGFSDGTSFLNQVVEIETELSPDALLEQLLTIEVKLGRIRPFDGCGCGIPSIPVDSSPANDAPLYSSRTIDIDILFYGQQLVFTDRLMIPHPRLHERRFTLVPLNDLAPRFVHPMLKRSVSDLLKSCMDRSKVSEYKISDI